MEVSCAVRARVGTASSETVAYINGEKEFTSKNITVKLASTVAGLAAAAALKAKSIKLTMERASEAFNPLGTGDTPEFDRGVFEAKGELVIRYTDTQYETDYIANTIKALLVTMSNGTTELSFTASKIRYRELEKSDDRDEIVTQTISFACEFDVATGYSVQPVLKNTLVRATWLPDERPPVHIDQAIKSRRHQRRVGTRVLRLRDPSGLHA